MEKTIKKGKFKQVFILFLTSFILGFIFSLFFGDSIKNELLKTNIIKQNSINNGKNISKEFKELDLSEFWKVYDLVKDNYYGVDEVEKKDIVNGIIGGFIDSLDDKFSEFMEPAEKESFEKVLSGDFEGIGAVVEKVPIGVKIERLLKGSPAKESGLKKGDIIIEANSIKLEELNLYDAVDKIKGPAGTKVLLNIFRVGEIELLNIEVIRKKIKIPSVENKFLEKEQFGYISLNMFGENTPREFKKSLDELNKQNIKGLIIDLRDNGGGYLQKAVEILSNLIEDGKILVKTKYRDDFLSRKYLSINDGKIFDKKIVIIMNSNSASASEIMAGALRDYNKAILIGEKTYGKGSVQQPFNLTNGGLLKLTIAKWFTPNGKNIDKQGIEPDIEVKLKKEDYSLKECKKINKCDENMKEEEFKFYDRQLEEAKKTLEEFIKIQALQVTVDKENKRLKNENKIEK